MEKFSKWRDPATGIQPFLPPLPPSTVPPFLLALTLPFRIISSVPRAIVLAFIALLHLILVDGICLILTPIPAVYNIISGLFTALTCRLALLIMGYYWITTEMVSPKRGAKGVAQISNRSPRKGDLIVTNWTSYVDVLYLAFRHNPTFLLPIFETTTSIPMTTTGRHTGTGSAQIVTVLPQPKLLGYLPIPLTKLVQRTGSLPETYQIAPKGMYKTLREARRKESRVVCVFPEGTTGNGRAVLRFAEGTLAQGDIGGDDEGIVWVKFIKHPAPTSFLPSATCPLPKCFTHLLLSLLWSPYPLPSRSLYVRTLHPTSSPSSPSFLPSEILASAPGGLDGLSRDGGEGVWREAVATVLAETGRVRRVKGMGWVEKQGFLDYWNGRNKNGRR